MTIKTIIAGSASAVVLLTQTAFAGSLAPVVDCNVTPDAPECAVVTLAPTPGSSGSAGLGGMGAAGTAAAVGGGILALAAIAALVDDDDDSDDSTPSSPTGEED